MDRKYDITVFGATGFTGKLTAMYLASKLSASPFKLAIAGRNKEKLQRIKDEFIFKYPLAKEIGLVVADVNTPAGIRQMVKDTKIIISTVGPYLKYGEELVRACAEEGTHYLDITGEGGFVEAMEKKYHSIAEQNKAKIINCCGYDSIPADLGTYFTIKQLPAEEPKEVECFISVNSKDLQSGLQSFSGGTWHSALGFMNPEELNRQNLSFERIQSKLINRKIAPIPTQFRLREETNTFGAPLPFVDVEVVLRSAANMEEYGPDFKYGHYAAISSVPLLLGGIFATAALFAMAQIPPVKNLLYSFRESGEGPDEEIRNTNTFCHSFVGKSATRTIKTEVRGGDPGYGDTSKMLGESALCLLQDAVPERYGVITTSYAMGDALIARLQKAGILFYTVSK